MQDEKGFTALMFAAGRGNEEAVECLKQYELGMKNKDNLTALMLAASNG